MSTRIAGITPEGAISTIVTAEIRERDEYLTRVGDHSGFELFFCSASGGEQFGQNAV